MPLFLYSYVLYSTSIYMLKANWIATVCHSLPKDTRRLLAFEQVYRLRV